MHECQAVINWFIDAGDFLSAVMSGQETKLP